MRIELGVRIQETILVVRRNGVNHINNKLHLPQLITWNIYELIRVTVLVTIMIVYVVVQRIINAIFKKCIYGGFLNDIPEVF